ncbi:hypothetical protein ACFY3M_38535 [Streptomyces mirabilis]|uniref:hypothetical protein n=1 Tax=Streptomyces mirabilis TaxID=68239 RepID=UPI0036AB5D82
MDAHLDALPRRTAKRLDDLHQDNRQDEARRPAGPPPVGEQDHAQPEAHGNGQYADHSRQPSPWRPIDTL